METFTLHRQPSTPDGTFGQIFRNGEQQCVTCEPEIPFPCGMYLCIPHDGPKFKNVWEITGIPGHSAVLIHNGNTEDDTKLCVCVGSTYGRIDGKMAVVDSVNTLNKLRLSWPKYFNLSVMQEKDDGT